VPQKVTNLGGAVEQPEPPPAPALRPLRTIPSPASGSLGVVEAGDQVPFDIKRAFYLFGLPKGARRGDHAHRKQHQFIICLSGGLRLEAQGRSGRLQTALAGPDVGVYLPPLCWVSLRATDDDTVVLVLASDRYDEADYIHDHTEFEKILASIPE